MTIVPGDIDAKNQKNLPQSSHTIFLNAALWIIHCSEHLMVQNFCKNSFSGRQSRKNGIPVKKSHFLYKKFPRLTGFDELTPKL